jgi:hypothetical protein
VFQLIGWIVPRRRIKYSESKIQKKKTGVVPMNWTPPTNTRMACGNHEEATI